MKGSFYILESVIAIVLMVSTLILIFQKPPQPLELSKTNYKLEAYNALKILESTGDLRREVLEEDVNGIEQDLSDYISVKYGVVIFNKTSNLTEVPTITTENLITIGYFLAGDVGNYTPREVRVYLWGFE